VLKMLAGFAIDEQDDLPKAFKIGQGWLVSAPGRRSVSLLRTCRALYPDQLQPRRSCSVKHRRFAGAV